MNLRHLTDHQLNLDLKTLVQNERQLLTQILFHLKEIETRKLYSNYNCSSLFDYACKELKYSSDQAFRRIQAMRLLKSLPEDTSKAVVQKIDSGELTLSNITQAQKFFKDSQMINKTELLATEKIQVLKKLINKSTRDGQKELLKLSPVLPLPLESKKQLSPLKPLPEEAQKQITPTYSYVSFNMSEDLEQKLEEIKTLLGPKAFNQHGQALTMAELIDLMAELSKEKLMEKKFGKKILKLETRSTKETLDEQELNRKTLKKICHQKDKKTVKSKPSEGVVCVEEQPSTLNVQGKVASCVDEVINSDKSAKPTRYISKPLKYKIWTKAKSKCEKCSSNHNLQIDHIKPYALEGQTDENNLRLLCFQCNQRNRLTSKL